MKKNKRERLANGIKNYDKNCIRMSYIVCPLCFVLCIYFAIVNNEFAFRYLLFAGFCLITIFSNIVKLAKDNAKNKKIQEHLEKYEDIDDDDFEEDE